MIKFSRNSNTISGRLHDELVMMDPDRGKYYSLNPLATRIWDLLASPISLDNICTILREEYEVDSKQCYVEVKELLEKLSAMGLVFKETDKSRDI